MNIRPYLKMSTEMNRPRASALTLSIKAKRGSKDKVFVGYIDNSGRTNNIENTGRVSPKTLGPLVNRNGQLITRSFSSEVVNLPISKSKSLILTYKAL